MDFNLRNLNFIYNFSQFFSFGHNRSMSNQIQIWTPTRLVIDLHIIQYVSLKFSAISTPSRASSIALFDFTLHSLHKKWHCVLIILLLLLTTTCRFAVWTSPASHRETIASQIRRRRRISPSTSHSRRLYASLFVLRQSLRVSFFDFSLEILYFIIL